MQRQKVVGLEEYEVLAHWFYLDEKIRTSFTTLELLFPWLRKTTGFGSIIHFYERVC